MRASLGRQTRPLPRVVLACLISSIPFNDSLRSRASRVVGGLRFVALSRRGLFAPGAAAAQEEEDESADDDEEADELRGREAGQGRQSGDVAARVVADELDEEARQAVEHGVGGDDLAVEA